MKVRSSNSVLPIVKAMTYPKHGPEASWFIICDGDDFVVMCQNNGEMWSSLKVQNDGTFCIRSLTQFTLAANKP